MHYYSILEEYAFIEVCNVNYVDKHLRWEKHRKILKTQTYLHKFKKDYISKVPNYYYCEVCNSTIMDIKDIPDHINKEAHRNNKLNPDIIKEKPKGYYAIGRVVLKDKKISEYIWNGIVNNKCVICDVTLDDDMIKHCTLPDHIVKLIETEVDFQNEQGYRKVNLECYHCFMCNQLFNPETFFEHYCCKPEKTVATVTNKCKTTGRKLLNLIAQANKAPRVKSNLGDIVEEESSVMCEVCNEEIPYDFEVFFNHMQRHNYEASQMNLIQIADTERQVIDHGKLRSELAAYGREHSIKLNAGGSKGFCVLCSAFLSAHLKVFKSHVEGAIHTGHLEIKNHKSTKKSDNKYPTLNKFIKFMLYYKDLKSFYINTSISVKNDSFMLMNKIEHGPHYKKTKCYACDVSMALGTEYLHCRTEEHKKNVMSSTVILHEDNNFVREIRPNLYHCGCCNLTFPFINILKRHITSFSHLAKIRECNIANLLIIFLKKYGVPAYSEQLAISSNIDNLYIQIMKSVYGKHII
ncbi:uncharacterized protein LOC101742999 isoform X2 [Bombyx mori]|uniref:C2H2-type domain-containing protein n=1 Tax=Bombyx mori TaxID=7091 RepID=A0A8R2M7M7_BOMMO|nr:uncharacterized protein LOC101742999 isoform X2 [Bombyx mori]